LWIEVKHDFSIIIHRKYIDKVMNTTNIVYLCSHPI
jgi:hypothetical protein